MTTAQAKSLAATPPMGWNSWNMFGSNVSEAVIRETAVGVDVSLDIADFREALTRRVEPHETILLRITG